MGRNAVLSEGCKWWVWELWQEPREIPQRTEAWASTRAAREARMILVRGMALAVSGVACVCCTVRAGHSSWPESVVKRAGADGVKRAARFGGTMDEGHNPREGSGIGSGGSTAKKGPGLLRAARHRYKMRLASDVEIVDDGPEQNARHNERAIRNNTAAMYAHMP